MNALEKLIADMTLGELACLADTSVERVVDLVLAGQPAVGPSNNSTGAATRGPAGKLGRGGLRLDHVLATLASLEGSVKLEDVRMRTGGTPQQVRTALQKLAKAAKVRITGERRGTRYAAR